MWRLKIASDLMAWLMLCCQDIFSIRNSLALIDNWRGFEMNTLHLHLVDDQGWRIVIL